ncbi:TatD family deoxyribonuclease [Pseudoduganella sp. FT26W]|uniref:TatD family deoxyribonuclease n=2 Tax=Duganella aquatilis TaxID=2666082 RepID=A0A844CV31_9BURK|nr:TatD family deoxyribonuclease [Duganella aquatilis]
MDFHCHLDLYPKAREVYAEALHRNEFTWLVTTSPKAFDATSRVLGSSPKVLITPGLHPEIAHERATELELLLSQIPTALAVGEVGLDGSPRFKKHYEVQCKIFEAVVRRCAESGGRVLSIHSRRAVKDVLALLQKYPGFGTAVMHWFSGTPTELKAAEAQGCWFSVGPAMFETANGRSLAAKMPRNRVVPESDGPFATVEGKMVMPWSADDTARHLSALWGISVDEAKTQLTNNSEALLTLIGHP